MLGDDDPVTVRLRVDADQRRPARSASSRGDATRRRRAPTAPSTSSSTITNRAAFRSFVLGLRRARRGDRPARGPRRRSSPGSRQRRGRCTDEPATARGHRDPAHPRARCRGSSRTRARPRRRSRSGSASRVDQLDEDLALVLMIGVPPYSPGDYLDVDEDGDGGVTIRLADYFRRPAAAHARRRSRAARRRAARCSPCPARDPEGPLATALAQARSARSTSRTSSSRSARRRTSTRSATRSHHHERVEIDYWSAGRDELTTPAHRPRRRRSSRSAPGTSSAYCHRADDERMFRVDRIRGLRATGEHFEPAPTATSSRARSTTRAPDDPRVTLAPRADRGVGRRGVSDAVGDRAARRHASTSRSTVSEPAWLERLLLRLGPDAEVVDPPESRAGRGRRRAPGPRPLYRGFRTGSSSDRSGTGASERA